MGVISKGAKCDVSDCDNDGIRSLNTSKVEEAGLRVSSSGKKTVLCKSHYKEWNEQDMIDFRKFILPVVTMSLSCH